MSIDIIKYEDLVWGRFLGRGAEGPVHACMYLDTPVAVKQTSSSTELEMNLSTGGPRGWWLEWEGSMLAHANGDCGAPATGGGVLSRGCGSGPLLHALRICTHVLMASCPPCLQQAWAEGGLQCFISRAACCTLELASCSRLAPAAP